MTKPRTLRNITRVDHSASRTHAWTVTVQRRGQIVNKVFSDGVWGGREQALAAAKRFRQRMRRKLPALSLAEYCQIRKRSNRSGIPGVCRHVQTRESGGKSIYWVASCPTERGKPRGTSNSRSRRLASGQRSCRRSARAAGRYKRLRTCRYGDRNNRIALKISPGEAPGLE